ncbi:MAG TPA: glycoside hydrolase family 6 protein, partial [Polyangia bacterium]|nr:glycoside hydrolase family 6 protein [Polyangia bacterium]
MIHQRVLAVLSVSIALSACASIGKAPSQAPTGRETSLRNPFLDVNFFLNPEYVENVEATAKAFPAEADAIRKVKQYPTGLWLDSIAHVANLPLWLAEARKQQQASGKPTLSLVVVYDMPDRDCSAKSSAGELIASQNGAARYRTEFIDVIAKHFKDYSDLPIVAILEPDSLGNLVTNLNLPKCSDARSTYVDSTVYAIQKLQLPNVSIYLDAAHAGWLGWDHHRESLIKVYKKVLKQAGGYDMIRGFATNVSNYTHLSNRDGMAMESSDPCYNEMIYVKKLAVGLSDNGVKNKGFIIDTARNGKGGIRKVWGHWCNIKGAGLGERPRAAPGLFLDAYFWVKPPGESYGISDPTQPRFDAECASDESAPNAPQAGAWFQSYFVDLVRNAVPPL